METIVNYLRLQLYLLEEENKKLQKEFERLEEENKFLTEELSKTERMTPAEKRAYWGIFG